MASGTPLTKPLPDAPLAPHYQPLVFVAVAAGLGILADRVLGLVFFTWWFAAIAAWIGWLVLWRRRSDIAASGMLLLAIVCVAGAWHHQRWNVFGSDELGLFARDQRQPVCLRVVALGGPRRVPAPPPDPLRNIPVTDRSRLDVKIEGIRDGRRWIAASGRATLLVEGHLLGVHFGDRLRVFAQLSRPSEPQNPGAFDFARHSRTDRKLSQLWANYPDCVKRLESSSSWRPGRLIEGLRSRGNELLWRHLSHERAGLAAAVLLGSRERLQREWSEAFFETGTIHLMAISGLHVGLLAAGLFFVLRVGLMPRGPALLAVAGLTIVYTLLTDARPPAIRATILVLVVCLSMYVGRRGLSFNSLAAAALVVLAINPADLFRTGTQLSFLAVATLMWLGERLAGSELDPLKRLIAQSRAWPMRATQPVTRWLWWLILMTTAIWLVTLPLVMARFHLLSPAAVVLGPVLWIPVAVALMSGFVVLLFGWLIPPVGSLFGWICDGSLDVLASSVSTAQSVSGSHYWVTGPDGWWLIGFYGALGFFLAWPRFRPPRRWSFAILVSWIALGFGVSWAESGRDGRLDCTFLSVGHGTAVVLELPDGKTLLYDGGRLGSPSAAARPIASYLWSRGITHIDAVVLSHADVDHYNALPELLERFSVGIVYVSPVMLEDEVPAIRRLVDAIDRAEVPIKKIWSGDRLQTTPACKIEVLHPPRHGVIGISRINLDNANSIVLVIEYAGRRILLPGDLESPGLDDLVEEEPLDCDVVLAPHHGSSHSNPPSFLNWCTPRWTVISGGRGRNVALVEAAYRRVGSRVFHTAKIGAVRITIDQDRIYAKRLRE